MSTAYEKAYPQIIPGTNPDDVKDGSHSVAQLAAKHDADFKSVNAAAAASGTSVFDDGKPSTGGLQGPNA